MPLLCLKYLSMMVLFPSMLCVVCHSALYPTLFYFQKKRAQQQTGKEKKERKKKKKKRKKKKEKRKETDGARQ